MHFPSTFIIAASAVFFRISQAAPMERGGQGGASTRPQGQGRGNGRGQHLRDFRPRPLPEEAAGHEWFRSLSRGIPGNVNEYGSPIHHHHQPQHGHGQGHVNAESSGYHSETYASSAPPASRPETPMYVARPLASNDHRLKNVKIQDIPYAEEHPDYKV